MEEDPVRAALEARRADLEDTEAREVRDLRRGEASVRRAAFSGDGDRDRPAAAAAAAWVL